MCDETFRKAVLEGSAEIFSEKTLRAVDGMLKNALVLHGVDIDGDLFILTSGLRRWMHADDPMRWHFLIGNKTLIDVRLKWTVVGNVYRASLVCGRCDGDGYYNDVGEIQDCPCGTTDETPATPCSACGSYSCTATHIMQGCTRK